MFNSYVKLPEDTCHDRFTVQNPTSASSPSEGGTEQQIMAGHSTPGGKANLGRPKVRR